MPGFLHPILYLHYKTVQVSMWVIGTHYTWTAEGITIFYCMV